MLLGPKTLLKCARFARFWKKMYFIFPLSHEIPEIPPYKIDHNFFVRGSFLTNKGSKRSYAIIAFQKTGGIKK